MKTSEILREAAIAVDAGRSGVFTATNYSTSDDGDRVRRKIESVLPKVSRNGLYKFSPFDLPQEHRATILALAAAIAESEGD